MLKQEVNQEYSYLLYILESYYDKARNVQVKDKNEYDKLLEKIKMNKEKILYDYINLVSICE